MGICWYCYWGWPKPVAEIYKKALSDLGESEFPLHSGPGHVVWADENFDFAEECIEHFNEYADTEEMESWQLAIVRKSLEELAALPLDIRCPEPDDYDDERPELYPPADGVEMVRI